MVGACIVWALSACEAPTRAERASETEELAISGQVLTNGDTILERSVTFRSDEGGELVVGTPVAADTVEVRIDGGRDRAAGGSEVVVDIDRPSAVVRTLTSGAAERYVDVAQVEISLWSPEPGSVDTDPAVPFTAELALPGEPVSEPWVAGALASSVEVDGAQVRIEGLAVPWHEMTLVVTMRSEALSEQTVLRAEPMADYLAERLRDRAARGIDVADRIDDAARRQDLLARGYWALVGVEIAIPVLIVAGRLIWNGRLRRRAVAGAPRTLSEPPSDEAPAVVALVMANGHDIGDEAVAATVVDLAVRRAIELWGVTSTDWVIEPGSGPAAEVSAGEAELIAALRAAADGEGRVTGPPLPIGRGHWWKALRRDVVRRARAAGLVRRRVPSGLFGASVVALGATTAPLWLTTPARGAVGGIAVAVLCALPRLGGFTLTPAGHRVRAEWEAYARHIRAHESLEDVGAPGVAIWGPHLAYAAAMGVADATIDGLSPRGRADAPSSRRRVAVSVGAVALILAVAPFSSEAQRALAQEWPCEPGSRVDRREANPSGSFAQDDLRGVDLSCQDLRGIDFTQADLSGADLTRADLSEAQLGQADLTDATLAGAILDGAYLVQTTFDGADLHLASLVGVELIQNGMANADLSGANLAGARLTQVQFEATTLAGVVLTDAVISSTTLDELDMSGARLDGALLTASSLVGTNLSGATLTEADLTFADATRAIFHGADLTGSDLTFGTLVRADLRDILADGVDFTFGDFTRADARGGSFVDTDMSGVTLDGADFSDAIFRDADFSPSSVRDASFRNVDFTGADVRGLDGADTTGATGLPASAVRSVLPWLLAGGGVLLAIIVLGIVVSRSRGIAADEPA